MNDLKRCLPWIALAIVAAVAITWAFPTAFPLYPSHWSVTANEAKAIALERFLDLGEPVEGGMLVARMVTNDDLEWRSQNSEPVTPEELQASDIARHLVEWRVTAHPPAAQPEAWAYKAFISLDGQLNGLLARVDPKAEGGVLEEADAIAQADDYLRRLGFDLDDFDRPEVRGRQLESRTDLEVRYLSREAALGEDYPYGYAVRFAGDQLVGFEHWYEDPEADAIEAAITPIGLLGQVQFLMIFVFGALIGVLFLKRYHAGEVGVRRSLHILVLIMLTGGVSTILFAAGMTDQQNWGIFTRRQIMFVWGAQFFVIFGLTISLVSFVSWSVGESIARERWGRKLAAFDALFQGDWKNATVARAAVRGLCAGLVILGGILTCMALLARSNTGWVFNDVIFNQWIRTSAWPGLSLFLMTVVTVLARELVSRLFMVSWFSQRFGLWIGGCLAAVVGLLFFFPSFLMLPVMWTFALIAGFSAVMVILFQKYDLLTILIASFVAEVGMSALGLIYAADPSLQAQGWSILAFAALPAALSVRSLGSGREFVYRWDDIPPHVRRIADRERQRVELETARNIQSSILPDLPPTLAGVDVAHAYLPASEVGGDFYDVLALEDGRLAVAVGDVAGHGVSSGLVMSAAKSALAVQVTFDSDVAAVFQTLNRMVYQSARKRLLATLCYAVLDPNRREISFGSAGHLFPYVVGSDGRIRSLESVAYPLGVRGELDVKVTKVSLAPQDTLVLFSDGLVEAHAEGSDEQFGFQRFEESLLRHVPGGVNRVRDGILADVDKFVGSAPRDDDQTILVLKLP